MAESEAADSSKHVIKVEEEIEGDQIGTRNYRFSKIGEAVPIKSDTDFKFDMDNLPSRPMAVSERFGVIFVAHSSGFCVARTKDVMDTAEEIKNGGNGSCIQELSVVDVSIGKVSILALSADSSILAACVGSNLYFFSVDGLLNKDQEPSFSKSLNGSSSIKDIQWSPRLKDKYVVLTSDGKLYHASGQDDLKNLMDNVDAVNWNMDGKFLAVAKYDYLSILSSKFEEKLQIKLLFDSLVDDSEDSVVKVDSLRWARPDCIILGCYCLNADGKEENYLLQLISVKDGKITNTSSNPVSLTFSDAFLAINEDDIPSGSGPHMFVSYLDEYEVAFVANRKNTDQHIVLFSWPSDKNNEAEMIEITNDAWLPTINLQDNSDDNLILGIGIDKVYKDEKLKLTLGEEDTEVSPCCILMCLTIDAKLFMFHFASATGPSLLSEDLTSVSDEENESPSITSQHSVTNIINNKKQIEDQSLEELQPQKVKVDEGAKQQEVPVASTNSKDKGGPLFKAPDPLNLGSIFKDLKKSETQEVVGVKTSSDSVSKSSTDKPKPLFGGFQDFTSVNKSSPFGFPGSSGSFSSGSLFSSTVFGTQSSSSSSLPFTGVQVSAESSGKIGSTTSGTFSSGGMFSSRTLDVKSPFSNTAVQGKQPNTSAGTTPLKLSFPKMPSASTTSSPASGVINTLPVISSAPPSVVKSLDLRSSEKGNQRSQTQSKMLNSDPNLSEQRSVEEMAKELDTLLDSIQCPGGFLDSSIAAHKPSVAALEKGIFVLSERCRKWTDTMNHGNQEVQNLLDKTVQVLARKIYMEAIVKQATDSQYLDIWNRQKLSSELDMKRKHILEINQNLTNQLIELERHLNTLELQRFGDKGDMETNRRSIHTRHGPPRHVQSLHSLHNTMNAQLAAAEKLSECLSRQMTMLSIETGPTKKQNIKKELFDTIGISYDTTTTFSSPSQEKSKSVPQKSQLLISSSSAVTNSGTKKSQQVAVKNSEPETARRRRDSLDRSWASIEPPKTTVKRMVLKEDRTSPARLTLPPGTKKLEHQSSVGPVVSRNPPPVALSISQSSGSVTQVKRNSEGQLNSSSLWGNNSSDSYKTPTASVPWLGSGLQSTPVISQEAEKSKSGFTFTLKSEPAVVNVPKISQPSPTFLEPPSNTSKSPTTNIFLKKPIEFPEPIKKETEKPKLSFGDINQKPKVAETTSIWSKKSQDSSFSNLSSATSSSTAFSGKSFSLESSTKQVNEAVSSSVTSTPVISLGKFSTTFGIKSDATQSTTPPAPSPSPSFPSFPSPVKPTNVELNTPKPEQPKFDIKPNENPSVQISPPTPVVSSVATISPSLTSNSKPEQKPLIPPISNPVEVAITQEDEMEEEAPVPESLGNFGGFGLGSTPNPSATKPNPFGAPFGNPVAPTPVPSFAPTQPSSGLFRPASFNIESSPPLQPPQPTQQSSFGAFSGGFGGGGGQGFGQPAQIGSGQQALGSVLGSFGQSRQFGAPSSFGGSGFGGTQTGGGFAAAPSGGGFASLATGGGGFGGLATGGGGGFAAAATGGGGGFGGAASGSGGFAGAATGGGGFGGAAAGGGGGFGGAAAGGGGGFGAFGSQGGSGFSTFGSSGGTARPPSELFTQMRR